MIRELTNHVWQSTLFACAAGLLTVAFRKNRANVRYWLWFCASLKFVFPFALLMSVGSHLEWAPVAKRAASPAVSFTVVEIAQPFPQAVSFTPAAPGTRDWLPAALLAIWACGFASVALLRFRGWLRVSAAVRGSVPIEIPAAVEVRSSPGLLEPGVVGIFRAVLLLPAGIADRLTPPQLEAVLAHELCHVRRHDNLFAAIHMVVEAAFWFHPLVWWVGARLVEERERACDEEVLRLGSQPNVYAEGILNVCKLYAESPLACVSGVTGSDLKSRIEAIMANRVSRQLSFAKRTALAFAAMAALAAPVFIGILNAPAGSAQAGPKFEVASIKFSKDCGELAGTPRDSALAKKKGGGGSGPSPGRVHACATLEDLIQDAYVVFKDGYENRNGGRLNRPPMAGGPAWVQSDRYAIDAKAEGAPGNGVMRGAMMRALLEERFQLKIHREAREAPVYDLTAGRNGPKVKPFQPGTCEPRDPNVPMPPRKEGVTPCMYQFRSIKGQTLIAFEAQGTSYDNFSKLVAVAVSRPVINKTGIPGLFDFHVEFTPDSDTPFFGAMEPAPAPVPAEETGPSFLAAVQEQLGLKLEPAKGPREFLVIDSVQRPTRN